MTEFVHLKPQPFGEAATGYRRIYHQDAHPTDCYVDWVLERYQLLLSENPQPPLIVPVTATFKLGSIRPDEVLLEYERFYARLCSRLIKNYDRPSKRHLLPFGIAWRDDPRTRPDKYRARPAWQAAFFRHPSVAPHVHGVLVIHPQLVDRFRELARHLDSEWKAIKSFVGPSPDGPVYRNGCLWLDLDSGERISRGLLGDKSAVEAARDDLSRWLGYSSKLARRFDAGEPDAFTVLPTVTNLQKAA